MTVLSSGKIVQISSLTISLFGFKLEPRGIEQKHATQNSKVFVAKHSMVGSRVHLRKDVQIIRNFHVFCVWAEKNSDHIALATAP